MQGKKQARTQYIELYKQPALLLTSGSVRAEALKVYLRWMQKARRQVASELGVTLKEMEQAQGGEADSQRAEATTHPHQVREKQAEEIQ